MFPRASVAERVRRDAWDGGGAEAGRAHDPVAAFALRRESRATRAARGRVSFAKVIFLSSATPIVPKWEKIGGVLQ